MFRESGKTIADNADYIALSAAIKTKKLITIQILSLPGSRSTLLNFSLGGAIVQYTANKFLPLHEPFIQGRDSFTKIHADKAPYSIYAKALERIHTAYKENKLDSTFGITVKDHCDCFSTGENHKINKKLFMEYMQLINGATIITIREPIAVFNNRLRAVLNFKLTKEGGLHSETFFQAFFQNDCEAAYRELLALIAQKNTCIDTSALLTELKQTHIEKITINDLEQFRINFLTEQAETFILQWSKSKEIYLLLNSQKLPVIIINTSDMCKKPENYLESLMKNVNGAQYHADMINNIPKKSRPYPYNYAGIEYGHERIENIFLKNSLISTTIQPGEEVNQDPALLPKELLSALDVINEIYSFLNSNSFKYEAKCTHSF